MHISADDSGKRLSSPRKRPSQRPECVIYQLFGCDLPSLPAVEFCGCRTRLAADWQWNSPAGRPLAYYPLKPVPIIDNIALTWTGFGDTESRVIGFTPC